MACRGDFRMVKPLLAAVLLFGLPGLAATDPLVDGFRSPPVSVRPRVWWHWTQGFDSAGLTMGPWGSEFNRANTLWPYFKPWIAYLARANFLLGGNGLVSCVAM